MLKASGIINFKLCEASAINIAKRLMWLGKNSFGMTFNIENVKYKRALSGFYVDVSSHALNILQILNQFKIQHSIHIT